MDFNILSAAKCDEGNSARTDSVVDKMWSLFMTEQLAVLQTRSATISCVSPSVSSSTTNGLFSNFHCLAAPDHCVREVNNFQWFWWRHCICCSHRLSCKILRVQNNAWFLGLSSSLSLDYSVKIIRQNNVMPQSLCCLFATSELVCLMFKILRVHSQYLTEPYSLQRNTLWERNLFTRFLQALITGVLLFFCWMEVMDKVSVARW